MNFFLTSYQHVEEALFPIDVGMTLKHIWKFQNTYSEKVVSESLRHLLPLD